MTRFFKPDSGQALEIQDEGGSAALTIETDGDVNLAQDIYLAAGKGIYFDGGTTSANYLGGSDAYEEGSWSPILISGGGGEVVIFRENTGYYTKVGNQVFCVGWFRTFSIAGGSGSVFVGGLPFQQSNDVYSASSGVFGLLSGFTGYPSYISGCLNESYFQFGDGGYGSALSWYDWSDLRTTNDSNQTRFAFCYRTT